MCLLFKQFSDSNINRTSVCVIASIGFTVDDKQLNMSLNGSNGVKVGRKMLAEDVS